MYQARDNLRAERTAFARFMTSTDLDNAIDDCITEATRTITRARTSEFENWCLRILLGAGGFNCKNVNKAITAKHNFFVGHAKGIIPRTLVMRELWALASPHIGND